MTQTFNIKRFGLCLKYRLFDPITLRYSALGLGTAILFAIIAATADNTNFPIGMIGGMIGGVSMFFGVVLAMNKFIDTLLPAQPIEKFLSFALVAALGAAAMLAFGCGAIILSTKFQAAGAVISHIPMLAKIYVTILAGIPIAVLIGNLINVDSNIMPLIAMPAMFLFFIPLLTHSVIWLIIIAVMGVALWIGAYATYKRRQVKNF